jgi:MFS transporter, OFA family, oxalate/formate antiporter
MDRQGNRLMGRWTYASIVIGAAIGMFAGVTSFNAVPGIFARPLAAEFGWGRMEMSLSFSATLLGMTVGSPLIGMLMDRFGIRRVILWSGIAFGLAVICMSRQDGSKVMWIGLSALIGLVGAAVSVLGYLAVFPQWFDRRLGLALALAMCGLGIGAMVMPTFTQYVVAHYGWRAAYVVLGSASVPLMLLACSLLKENKIPARERGTRVSACAEGMTLGRAMKSYRLWAIWLTFMLGSICTLALVPHLPSMFIDRGISAGDAARGASMLGVGLLTGRILTGVLLDHMHAPLVAVLFFLGGAAGILLFHTARDYQVLLLAAALIGLTIGAEGDLISYLVRAYLGMRSFGTLYGIAYSGYCLGSVVGPLGIGAYFDRHGSYDLLLVALPCVLLGACVLILTLGRYPGSSSRLEVVTP